jgi:hypothetical protein
MRDNKPKTFWKLFDELNNFDKSIKSSPISSEDWVSHFQSLLNKHCSDTSEEKEINDFIKMNKDNVFNELSFMISPSEIIKAIKHLKNGKASGTGGILNEMNKSSAPKFLPLFVKLFNAILSNGFFPSIWRINMITPLHKKGAKDNPANYRGIAISSHLSKLFCGVLHNRLNKYAQDHDIIPKEQIGYKAKTRTSDHIYTLKTIIDKYINKLPRKYLFCCFVDFKSAFDTVWRNGFLYELLKAGVGSNFFSLLSNIYSNTKYAIKMSDGLSEEFNSNVGIKQGCVLSPILFNIFLSDLPCISDQSCDPIELFDININCLMFADDLVLMSNSAIGLQNCLSKLESNCAKWKLTLNTNKTKVLIFNKGGHIIRRFTFTFNRLEIDIVTNDCYLGINFSASGNFKLAIESLHDKAKKALFKLKQHNLRDNVATGDRP